jgi:hypothetical protein
VPLISYMPSWLPQEQLQSSSSWVGLQLTFFHILSLCSWKSDIKQQKAVQCNFRLSYEENIRKQYNSQFFNSNLFSKFGVLKTVAMKKNSLLVCDAV